MSIRLFISLFCLLIAYLPGNTLHLTASHEHKETGKYELYDRYSTPWVDSVFNSLSLEERIGQLMMIRVHTDEEPVEVKPMTDFLMLQLLIEKEQTPYDSIVNLIEEYNIGGVAFFSGTPDHQVQMTNTFQKNAPTPLLIAMDAEWGLDMRLDSTTAFPYQMTLGAIQDERYIYEMGMEIARQLRRIGVNINFAPVVDVNSNPLNPVINFRSFGECRYNVTRKSLAYMRGLQDWGIIANAKHFPGHGDTHDDSHYTLPIIEHDHALIDSLHLYPFKQLFDKGLKSVMTAHLHIPTYDPTEDLASTLSKNVVTDLLQNDLGFEGLIITDALDMKGVSDYFDPGELELKALKAGNDILLLPEDVPAAIKAIKNAVENGEISEQYINNKCRKVLFYKEMAGVNNFNPIEEHNLYNDLNTNKAKLINKKLVENAITLIKNSNDLIPLKNLDTLNIASLSIEGKENENENEKKKERDNNHFQNTLSKYYPMDIFSVSRDLEKTDPKAILEDLKEYNLVIVSLHDNSRFAVADYGMTDKIKNMIEKISKKNNVILNLLGNPYILNYFDKDNLEEIESIIISYQDEEVYEESSAHVVFGGLPAKGKLPVSITPYFPAGTGIETPENFRIRSISPGEAGISPDIGNDIDSIVKKGISAEAYPGAQVVVIKDGNVIVNKSYGTHTYEENRKVKNSDIYDLASLTKITATTSAIMHLKDDGLIEIDKTLGDYLPWLKNSNVSDISLRDVMTHQGRLRSWIPFHLETIDDNGKLNPSIYSDKFCNEYNVQVAKELYIHKNYSDSVFNKIIKEPLSDQKNYRYSDLGFYLLAEIVKELSGMPLDEYVKKNFYKPMGLHTMTFNPLGKIDSTRIIPSEKDTLFRNQVLHGHVNDPGAAILGGVSGHAGLFSNAMDVAIMMQMFLQNGFYGGKQYISEEIIHEFTKIQYPENQNRRGIGFDKPSLEQNEFPTCPSASPESFGHTGFTGTYAWADPEENLVYVFLSNRVYPDSSNRKLIEMNIRTEIQQAIYDAIYQSKYLQSYKIP